MARPLDWIFRIIDQFSAPAKNINRELREMSGVTQKLTRDVNGKLRDQFGKFAGSGAGGHGGGGGGFFKDLKHSWTEFASELEVAGKFKDVAEGIADIGYEMGKAAVEAASFKENTLVSLETVLGSAGKAKELFQSTVSLADKLPVKTQEALEIETRFALAGFKDQATLQRMLVAAADVKALRGEEGVQGFVRQMGDIAAVGLSDRHLMYLSQESGIPENLIFDQLRKLTGRKGSDEEIKKLVSQHAFDRTTGETAVLQALAQLQGGQLGSLSGKLGQTVEGRLSTLKSRPFDFLKDLDESEGYASFRNFLGKLIDSTAPNSAFGTRIESAISQTFSGIFTRLFGADAGLDATLDKVARAIQDVGNGLQIAEAAGQGFFEGLFGGLNVAGDLFGPDGKLDPKKLDELQAGFKSFGTEVGAELTQVAGALQEIAGLIKTISDILPAGTIKTALRVSNDVVNPLAMQEEVKNFTAGTYLDSEHLERSASRFWQGAPGVDGGAGATTAHVQVEQNFHLGDVDSKDVPALAGRIKDDSASGMDAALQQLALNRGTKF